MDDRQGPEGYLVPMSEFTSFRYDSDEELHGGYAAAQAYIQEGTSVEFYADALRKIKLELERRGIDAEVVDG